MQPKEHKDRKLCYWRTPQASVVGALILSILSVDSAIMRPDNPPGTGRRATPVRISFQMVVLHTSFGIHELVLDDAESPEEGPHVKGSCLA